VTEEGIKKGGHLTIRILVLILGAKILTATTNPEDLVKAVHVILGPLGKWKPVRNLLATTTLTLRILPIIYSEAQLLYRENIQSSPDSTFAGKVRLSASLIIPLFEKSVKKAKEMSNI
jgi:energy-coupling factor transport system permease protein